MTEDADVAVTKDEPKGAPRDKSWLEVENVRGGENPAPPGGAASGDDG